MISSKKNSRNIKIAPSAFLVAVITTTVKGTKNTKIKNILFNFLNSFLKNPKKSYENSI